MRTFPKSRIDALTDGMFAFAMTLLVLDVRLPDDLPIHGAADLLAHLRSLGPEYLTYVISFFVLSTQWRVISELRHAGEDIPYGLLRWLTAYLFFITSVPFASSVVGHYGDLAPAVWVYAANMIVVTALSMPLHADVAAEQAGHARLSRSKSLYLIGTALVSVAVSFVEPAYAMWAYLLNFAGDPVCNWWVGAENA